MRAMATVDRLMELAAAKFKKDLAVLSAEADIFETLGVDSMQVLELLSELELEFDVEIPDYELKDVKSFEALAACIDRRL